MLKRTIIFTQPVSLRVKNLQLVATYKDCPENVKTVPIEDLGMVIMEDQQISITMPLLEELSSNNVAVVFCDHKRMPKSMLLNLDTNTNQGERFSAQLGASEPLKKNLWKQLVEAKIRNQAHLLNKYGLDGMVLRPFYSNVKSGDSDNREGIAARIYWTKLFGAGFSRERTAEGINALLNYGYTLLRAATARAIMGSGLFPGMGLFHKNRSNAFPLADDLMEPYRPFVDDIVYEISLAGQLDLNTKTKSLIARVLFCDTHFSDCMRPLDIGLTMTTASLAKCFSGELRKLSLPNLQ